MANQGSVMKMVITGYKDRAFKEKAGQYETMLNPDKVTLNRDIIYNTEQAPDSSETSQKYKHSPSSTLDFELLLDCTGVVDAKSLDLPAEIKKLQDLVYDYHGDIHRPYFVIIRWGIGETFQGVLNTFNTTYTLFDPDGIPLRAKISLKFTSYIDSKALAIEESKSSPDLTHSVSVVAGDSLLGLSQRVYDTPDYAVQLAQFNGLNKFRHIKPGQQLVFPPIVADTASDNISEAQS